MGGSEFMKQEEQYQTKQSLPKDNSRTESIKWGVCPAAGILLVVLSVIGLKGDAFVFWTWWLLALLLGLGFMPLSSVLFGRFEDKGWFFSKALAIACCGFSEWFLVAVKLMVFNTATCILVCVLWVAGMLVFARSRQKKDAAVMPWNHFRLIIYGELIFAAVFLIWTFFAGMRPEAYGTEKFMDYGFMEAMMRSRTLPAIDMWYSGGTLNYYYGGQYFAVFLTKLSGSRVEVTYNLMRTFIAGFAFILPCSLAFQMMQDVKRFRNKNVSGAVSRMAGLIAGTAVCFCGNMHYVVYRWIVPLLARLRGEEYTESYWFPDATRYIGFKPDVPDKTIHEFPCYSFVLGDLHAHVVNIIFVLLMIGLLYAWCSDIRDRKSYLDGTRHGVLKEIFQPHIFVVGLLLGMYQLNNFWDYVIYFVVAGGTILFTNLARQEKTGTAIGITAAQAALFAAVSTVVILPFTLIFKTMVSGVALCRHHSLPHQLLILWGLPCITSVLLIIAMIGDRRKGGKKNPGGFLAGIAAPDMYAGILALCAMGLVLIPEIVYVRDIYENGNARANTMFKLTYQAYIMFGIVMGYGMIRLIRISKKAVFKAAGAIALVCLAATAGYMGNACGSWYADSIRNMNYRGLYALGHLDVDFTADANAIYWLKDNVKGSPVVLEANGNSYTGYNRVSASTGLPTLLGWYVHEWLWRSDTEDLNIISEDIQTIYTSEDLTVVKDLLIDYNVSYIFVGAFEKEKFGEALNEDLLRSLGRVVFEDGSSGTFIVQVQGTLEGANKS